MELKGKPKAVKEWALSCPSIDALKVNATVMGADEKSIIFQTNERSVVEYIDGSAERELIFSLAYVLPWTDEDDGVNEEALDAVNSWIEWVSEAYPDNVPDFGSRCTIMAVEPNQNMSELVEVSQGLARYQLSAVIRYLEEKG